MPRKFLRFVLAALLLALPVAALLLALPSIAMAQSQKTDIRPNANRVIGDNLRAAFKGNTHSGAYNFTEKGQPTRFYEEFHGENGRVNYTEGKLAEPGAWLIYKDTLCYIYDTSDMPGGCFRVYSVANCYYFYSDQLIERADELDRDYWTARSVIKGQQPKCEAAVS